MSLTREIANKNSPVSRFLADTFGAGARGFLVEPRKRLKNSSILRPPASGAYPWNTVGSAIDYRIRYYFSAAPWHELVAAQGALNLQGHIHVDVDSETGRRDIDYEQSISEEFLRFFQDFDSFLRRTPVSGLKLKDEQEREFLRYCYVLALLDEVARSGLRPGTPLDRRFANTEQLLELASPMCIDDLRMLSRSFYSEHGALFSRRHVLNPTFEGSTDVSGADGDLIVDGALIDIKTSIQLQIKTEWLWQLLGYALLDYSDEHKIRKIGFYMTRQSMLEVWDIDDVLDKLMGSNRRSLNELRAEFKVVTGAMIEDDS